MLRIAVIVIGAVVMFGAVSLHSSFVHYPFIESRCAASCETLNPHPGTGSGEQSANIQSGYVGSSINERCRCEFAATESSPAAFVDGYFFVPFEFLDWFLLVWLRLIPIAIIGFLCVLAIAKIVQRLP